MQRNTALPIAALIVLVLVAAWAFSNIMGRRYSGGEVYPPYSSLRSDPLGTRALLDSLDRVEGITAARNFRGLEKLEGGSAQALMLFHLRPDSMSGQDGLNGKDIQAFAARGGRVIITLDGQVTGWDKMVRRVEDRRKENARQDRQKLRKKYDEEKARAKKEKQKGNADAKQNESEKKDAGKDGEDKSKDKGEKDEDEDDEAPKKRFRSLIEVLGLTIETKNFVLTAKGGLELEKSPALPVKEEALPHWYSKTSLKFEIDPAAAAEDEEDMGPVPPSKKTEVEAGPPNPSLITSGQWTALATVNDSIVLAERRYGQGSVVVATDSYFVSNEALLKEPSSTLLAWLVGNARHVIFDETHLGTTESPGIMTLARRLHLEGLFIGGLVLFGLFIWQSSASLVPSRSQGGDSGPAVVAGHSATAGLVSLLRRGIPRSQLLNKCYEVWEKSARQTGISTTRLAAAHQVLERLREVKVTARTIPGIYRQISAALHAPKRPPAPGSAK